VDGTWVSIVMPVDDGGRFQPDALGSVHGQSCPVLECVVRDSLQRERAD
jgi:hypothetical protein